MDSESEFSFDDASEDLINTVVESIFSYDDIQRQHMIDGYYFPEAFFISPLLSVQGNYNIKKVFMLWKAMNRQPPHIDNVCFDGQTCVVYLTQIIQPRLFPWITLKVPMIVNLGFRETDLDSGLWKVYMHEESWTIDGFLDSMPLISYWYQSVLRVFNGKLIVLSGKFIHTVTETAQLLKDRNQEIETATRRLSQGNVDAKQLSKYDTVMNGKHP